MMRIALVALPLAIFAAPAQAQQPAQLPPELADPAAIDRLTNSMQALSGAFLDLPVGEMQAALEGRKPTPADRRKTVRSETGLSERDLNARIAAARPQIEHSIRAMNQALPEITRNLQQAQKSVERAIANMPDPNYPKR